MNIVEELADIDYPESDGMPMGETDLHKRWIIRLYDILRYRYRGQRVYVGADLLLYYTEGLPVHFVVPDVFVVLDCEPGDRRIWQTWKEGRAPNVVFEVTSKYTKRNDAVLKPQTYAQIGVKELFLYDPTGDYLKPRLAGFRLENGQHQRLELDTTAALECHELDLRFRLDAGQLVVIDRTTGQPLLTEAEAAWAAVEATEASRDQEQSARQAAEARAAAAEEELQRLRAEIERDKRS